VQNQIAGNFEQGIADEKNTGAQTVDVRGEAQVPVHLRRCETHVDPIDEGREIQHGHERNQTAADLLQRTCAKVHRAGGIPGLRRGRGFGKMPGT